jgi:hypothetical protein
MNVNITSTVVNAATSSTAVLSANAKRRYVLIINDSDTTVYLSVDGANAAVNKGIRLNANGGSYEMTFPRGNVVFGAVNAIHGSTGNKVLLVNEG